MMKKYLPFILFTIITCFSNCSNNEDDSEIIVEPEKKMYLSKISITYYDNPSSPQTETSYLFYTDGILTKTTNESGSYNLIEYDSGKKITKIAYYNKDNTLYYNTLFTYNGDNLTNIKAVYNTPTYNRSKSYAYNSHSQLTSSTLCQSEPCTNTNKSTYTYNGDNISAEIYEYLSGFVTATKSEYTYDSKKNPYTNLNKYFRIMMEGAYTMSENNYKTTKISYKNSDGKWIENQNITYDIQYNNENFPTQVVGKDDKGADYVKYNYEYIRF